jgi:hypothetical protein
VVKSVTPRAVASDALVITPTGPLSAGSLRRGDEFVVLQGNGHLARACLTEEATSLESPCMRVLTDIGDVAVPAKETILTKTGPMLGEDLRAAFHAVRFPHVEVLGIQDIAEAAPWPRVRTPQRLTRKGALAALRSVGQGFSAMPAAAAVEHGPTVTGILKTAGVEWTQHADDRWCSWTWLLAEKSGPNIEVAYPTADSLLALTAWSDGSSRTVLSQHRLRAKTIASLAWERRAAKVAWTPGYRPVEARIAVAPATVSPYAQVRGAIRERTDVVSLPLDRAGAIVVAGGLAIGRLA